MSKEIDPAEQAAKLLSDILASLQMLEYPINERSRNEIIMIMVSKYKRFDLLCKAHSFTVAVGVADEGPTNDA